MKEQRVNTNVLSWIPKSNKMETGCHCIIWQAFYYPWFIYPTAEMSSFWLVMWSQDNKHYLYTTSYAESTFFLTSLLRFQSCSIQKDWNNSFRINIAVQIILICLNELYMFLYVPFSDVRRITLYLTWWYNELFSVSCVFFHSWLLSSTYTAHLESAFLISFAVCTMSNSLECIKNLSFFSPHPHEWLQVYISVFGGWAE